MILEFDMLSTVQLMQIVMEADNETRGSATRGTTNWAAHIGKAVQKAVIAQQAPAPMSDDNRKVAYAAADKLRKLGYSWDDGIGDWVKTDESASPTAGMNLAQRIIHVGGRNNAAGYVEFGSIQAVEALVKQVLRDQPTNSCASAMNT